jgi:Ala-tRNA(Pro) deacylase
MSPSLQRHLEQRGAAYDLVPHPHTETSMDTAAAAHVPGDGLAKAVTLKDGDRSLLMVVPSDYHVHLGRLHHALGREVGLATEAELAEIFPDCDVGAVPPVGAAFGLDTLVDRRMLEQPEVWFESGDHETLVHVSGDTFRSLLAEARRVDVAEHV